MPTSEATRRVPQIEDLFYVALVVLGEFSDSVPYREMDDRALELLDMGDDTLFQNKVRERLGFARSALKRIGAAHNELRGHWAITSYGREILSEGEDRAQQRLRDEIGRSYADRTVDPGFLDDASRRAEQGRPLRITVRDLLGQWKVARRGSVVNEQIREDLAAHGLFTDPDFTTTWIDGEVTLAAESQSPEHEMGLGSGTLSTTLADDISLTVGSIESASRGVQTVYLHDDILRAQSLMNRHDYSQLAVISGPRELRGAITWESIAQTRLVNPGETKVSQCVVDVEPVRPDEHLLSVVPRVIQKGFVLVQGRDRTLSGILTVADLSEQFAILAYPFVLLGEIEQWIRRAMDSVFTFAELGAAMNPNGPQRVVESAADLTLGEMVRVMEDPSNWMRLDWQADRQVFIDAMHDVRRVRNEVMHFSPDPLSDDDLALLQNLLEWVKRVVNSG